MANEQILTRSDGTPFAIIAENTVDTTSTSYALPGTGVVVASVLTNRNLVHRLENFSGRNAPANPMRGQLWYDSLNNLLKLYDGSAWVSPGGRLPTSPTLTLDGIANGSVSFDGASDVTLTATLPTTAVTPGTYTKITTDADGLVVSGSQITGTDVLNALGYEPAQSTDDLLGTATVPIYGILSWNQPSLPAGYVICNGQTANAITTPNLTSYAQAGTNYIMRVS